MFVYLSSRLCCGFGGLFSFQLPSLTQVGTSFLAPVRVCILSLGLLEPQVKVGFPITLGGMWVLPGPQRVTCGPV